MSILTANLNFLASLGITTSEQFTAAFGDMADFTEYCTAIGYSWELDENNDIILITPNGNKVNTYVPALSGPTSIQFDSASYSISGVEYDPSLNQNYTITDNLGNDVTNDCTITLYPTNTGIIVDGGLIDATTMSEGLYHITMTATYGELTATSTIDADIAAPAPQSISFDSASYSISGTAGDPSLTQSFTVEDDLGNIVTADCSFDCNPDVGLNVVPGEFDATSMSEGSYSTTVTATYGELTVTATVNIEIAAPAPQSISFDSASYSISGTVGDPSLKAYFDVEDDLGNIVTGDCTYTFSPDNTGLDISITRRGEFDATTMAAGTYTVTATATYGELTATATVNVEITDPTQIPNYMKLKILQSSKTDGDITITIPAAVDSSKATSLSYSYDGIDWTETLVDNTDQTITIPVSVGDEVYLKGIAKQWSVTDSYTPYSNLNKATIINSARMNLAVSGNIMSLLYGDNFENQTSFPANSTYNFGCLFANNSHIINASQLELPATTLAEGCYAHLFHNCTSLTSAPELPAMTLTKGCYEGMFKGCTSLTSAPALPATSFESPRAIDLGCYEGMFQGCTSLTQLPTLPATTLKKKCYASMFANCTSLTSVPSNYLPATTLAANCYEGMFNGCTSLTQLPTLSATTLTEGCYNLMFQGCTSLTSVPSNYLPAMTLPQPSNNSNGCYQQMFGGCTSLTSTPELPATTLTEGCYQYMFQGCTSLTQLPTLPATTLAPSCYANMFNGCTSLTSVPSNYLSTTTLLTEGCYRGMFNGCTSLTSAPALPATTLTQYCYRDMFTDCTSLTSAPELPATTLTQLCYFQMFSDCSSLNNITMLAEDISASNCLGNWVSGVAATGTFTKSANMTTLPTGNSGIPDNWTVVDYTP